MKTLFIALIVLLAAPSFAQETVAKETKKEVKKPAKGLTFTKLEIVRNDIPYGSDESFIFDFKNDSKIPAIIQGVQTSCGCTAAEKPSEPIKPGKKSKIVVKYDTKRVGNFTKTITVTSNVSEPIILTIKGTVLPQETKE
ncbi:MAG: DUF1573 domain-containing protein [Bacteroidetes bacterium]|nr:MAG: DUF1573 domain-containing protein [Bacteroidota bacterium]